MENTEVHNRVCGRCAAGTLKVVLNASNAVYRPSAHTNCSLNIYMYRELTSP